MNFRYPHLRYRAERTAYRRYCPGQSLGAVSQCSSRVRGHVTEADVVPGTVGRFFRCFQCFRRLCWFRVIVGWSAFLVESVLQTLSQVTRSSHHLRRVSRAQHFPMEREWHATRIRPHFSRRRLRWYLTVMICGSALSSVTLWKVVTSETDQRDRIQLRPLITVLTLIWPIRLTTREETPITFLWGSLESFLIGCLYAQSLKCRSADFFESYMQNGCWTI